MITVHNVNEFGVTADLHIYCGRNYWKYPHLFNAKVGNPYTIGVGCTRDEAIERYAQYMLKDEWHIKVVRRLAQRVQEGKTIALYCHCAPDACHCDVIAAKVMEIVNA
jgi:hypothetical protein